MSKVKDENFLTITGWMVNQLNLKGNELLIYAIIYGFSQEENQTFSGSLQYMADWTNSTKQGVIKCLKSLQKKELIGKNEKYINGVKFCEYYTTKFNGVLNKVEQGIKQSLTGGIKQSLPNNIDNNNIDNNIDNNSESQSSVSTKNIVDLFHSICKSYPKVRSISENRKKAIQARLRVHGIDTIKEVFEKAEASDFLKGKNNKNWSADFDWIMTDGNFSKILDGKYDNRGDKIGTNSSKPKEESSTVWGGIDFSDIYI